MAGVRFSSMLFLLIVLILMSLFVREIRAQDATTTSTYKSTTVERVTTVQEEVKTVVPPKKEKIVCAVFVKNRAMRVPDDKVMVLQDFATGHLTDGGFTVISRENAANAVSTLAETGANRGDAKQPGQSLDTLLSNNTSALQLARNLGADALLSVAVTSYDADKTEYNGHNISIKSTLHRLKVSYELVDAYHGGSITAGVATVSFSDRQQEGLKTSREGVLDDLLDAAASDLSNMLSATYNTGKLTQAMADAKAQNKQASFTINLSVANFAIPQIRKDDKGQYSLADSAVLVQPQAASVELDGVAVASTSISTLSPIKTTPGLHKLRLKRELFNDWEGTVFIADGQELALAMQLSDAGLKQYKELTSFLQDLKQDQALTEAQVKKIEGYAAALQQSGFKLTATQMPSVQLMNRMQ